MTETTPVVPEPEPDPVLAALAAHDTSEAARARALLRRREARLDRRYGPVPDTTAADQPSDDW